MYGYSCKMKQFNYEDFSDGCFVILMNKVILQWQNLSQNMT